MSDSARELAWTPSAEHAWNCRTLVIGTGTGNLPVMDAVKHEVNRRGIKLLILPTAEAIAALKEHGSGESDHAYHLLGATMSLRPRKQPLIGRQSSLRQISAHA